MDQAYDYYDAVVNNDINRAKGIKKAYAYKTETFIKRIVFTYLCYIGLSMDDFCNLSISMLISEIQKRTKVSEKDHVHCGSFMSGKRKISARDISGSY